MTFVHIHMNSHTYTHTHRDHFLLFTMNVLFSITRSIDCEVDLFWRTVNCMQLISKDVITSAVPGHAQVSAHMHTSTQIEKLEFPQIIKGLCAV